MKIIILAGGVGQRLWPLSHTQSPKQVQQFFGSQTLLERTVSRLRRRFSPSDIYIVTGKEYHAAAAQLSKVFRKQFIIESARCGTTAAIGLAAYTIAERHPKEVIISIASDHFIKEENEFLKSLRVMERVVRRDPKAVCLMGIKPAYPETGYGYIESGAPVRLVPGGTVYRVRRFVEKPDRATAERFIRSKRFFWNPSYFAWRVDRIKELFAEHIPETHRRLLRTVAGNARAFAEIKCPAIDYAIMEKLRDHFFVVPGRFSWADIGHWESVRTIQADGRGGNVTLGIQHTIDTDRSLIYNYTDRVVSAVGVHDLIIVQTDNGTLVCSKDRAQDVKRLVEEMRGKAHLRKFL
jgi:mannose-1-phosphate guanylyltransferase